MVTQQPPPSGHFGRALVGLHRTPADAGLLAYVAMLMRAGVVSEVVCVHVLPDSAGDDATGEQDHLLAEIESEARRHLGDATTRARVTFQVRRGVLLDTLLHAVADHQTDVVIIGHRQDHPLRRSLARRLAKLTPCSIWLVPDDTPPAITKVLVGIDFSAEAAYTLQTATAVAARIRLSDVMALHVYFNESRTTYEGAEAGIRGHEQAAFAAFVGPLDTAGVKVAPLFREGIHPADTIRKVADELSVDLLVMGTRGRSPSAAALLGSVAQETLVASRVPVLVVRFPGRPVGVFRALMEKVTRHEAGTQFD